MNPRSKRSDYYTKWRSVTLPVVIALLSIVIAQIMVEINLVRGAIVQDLVGLFLGVILGTLLSGLAFGIGKRKRG